jgi:hypothetical protein
MNRNELLYAKYGKDCTLHVSKDILKMNDILDCADRNTDVETKNLLVEYHNIIAEGRIKPSIVEDGVIKLEIKESTIDKIIGWFQ